MLQRDAQKLGTKERWHDSRKPQRHRFSLPCTLDEAPFQCSDEIVNFCLEPLYWKMALYLFHACNIESLGAACSVLIALMTHSAQYMSTNRDIHQLVTQPTVYTMLSLYHSRRKAHISSIQGRVDSTSQLYLPTRKK